MTKTGGWATDALLKTVDLVPVPAGLDPGEAETLVVSGLTAYQMLHRRAKIRAGQTVLIHGANGGVGTTLVQLALHTVRRSPLGSPSPRSGRRLSWPSRTPSSARWFSFPTPTDDAETAGTGATAHGRLGRMRRFKRG